MSKPIISGAQAMEIARQAALTANLLYFNITEAKQEDDKWIVTVESFTTKYQATIASTSGEVTEWKKVIGSKREGYR